MAEIGRLITAMLTPFDENGGVNYGEARRLAKGLIASGSDGLVVSGTTGESADAVGRREAQAVLRGPRTPSAMARPWWAAQAATAPRRVWS